MQFGGKEVQVLNLEAATPMLLTSCRHIYCSWSVWVLVAEVSVIYCA